MVADLRGLQKASADMTTWMMLQCSDRSQLLGRATQHPTSKAGTGMVRASRHSAARIDVAVA